MLLQFHLVSARNKVPLFAGTAWHQRFVAKFCSDQQILTRACVWHVCLNLG